MTWYSKYKMKIKLPSGVKSCVFDNKVRFIGNRESISQLAEQLRLIKDLSNGSLIKLGEVKLKVSNEITNRSGENKYIEMPNHAWNILASKIQDVVEGFEENPFDFNDCGYLYPPLPFDIGVEIKE